MKFSKTSLHYNVKKKPDIILFVCLLFAELPGLIQIGSNKTLLIVGFLQTSCVKLEGSVDRNFTVIVIFLWPEIAQGVKTICQNYEALSQGILRSCPCVLAITPFVPKPNVLLIQYIIFVTIDNLYY